MSGAWGFWHYPWVSFSDIWGLWRIDSQRLGHLQGLYSSSSRGMQGAWRGCISMYWHAFSLAAMGSKSKMGGPQSWGFIPLNYAAWGQSPANQQRHGKHWKTMETRRNQTNCGKQTNCRSFSLGHISFPTFSPISESFGIDCAAKELRLFFLVNFCWTGSCKSQQSRIKYFFHVLSV